MTVLAPSRSITLPSVSFSVHHNAALSMSALSAACASWLPLPEPLSVGVGWSVTLPTVAFAWRQQGLAGSLPSVSFSVHHNAALSMPALSAACASWLPLPEPLSVGVGWSVTLPTVAFAWRQQGLAGSLPSVSFSVHHSSVLESRFPEACAVSDWVWLPNDSYANAQAHVVTYFMRGIDDLGQFVYWSSVGSPTLSYPLGVLTNVCVVGRVG